MGKGAWHSSIASSTRDLQVPRWQGCDPLNAADMGEWKGSSEPCRKPPELGLDGDLGFAKERSREGKALTLSVLSGDQRLLMMVTAMYPGVL